MLPFLFDEEQMFKYAMEDYKAESEANGKIIGTIETMLDDGKPYDEIIKRLIKKFALTESEAKEKLSAYPITA